MRIGLGIAACAIIGGLAACSQENPQDYAETEAITADSYEAGEMVSTSDADMAQNRSEAAIASASESSSVPQLDTPGTMPKIAYSYDYGFSLPGDDIVQLQQRHADMCAARGASACRIIGMTGASADNEGNGRLELAVRSEIARGFGYELAQVATSAGGEQVSTAITGEDLSKQMVDTQARLEARTALRDRLLEVLRTKSGSVEELVEAERGVAQVNEEIDQAQAWIGEMRGRVSFSRLTLAYESSTPMGGSFARPIGDALGNIGGIAGTVIAWLMMLGAIVLPIGAVVYAGVWINRWAERRNAAPTEAG